ncbi:hypothetical protein FNH05_08020 [Amycolatopsis rhizosphaerae]|uniref:YceI family protein n=1 Tax=Amycolatopsis rhizosphaerae TaxID=2053003 RepID=A0A558D6Q1_9PSEU|nr:hypothetical protein [Amycolatopsis rhizosphaerae]TVT56690.1 hypothetical protein FNH05_08020 [Amycolatopsis rhizosphaerae]
MATTMAVDGTWTIKFKTPGGERQADLVFKTDGETLTGTFDNAELHDGRTDGKELSFKAQLTAPFKVKIKASATVEGDAITGKAKAGIMTIAFAGARKTR